MLRTLEHLLSWEPKFFLGTFQVINSLTTCNSAWNLLPEVDNTMAYQAFILQQNKNNIYTTLHCHCSRKTPNKKLQSLRQTNNSFLLKKRRSKKKKKKKKAQSNSFSRFYYICISQKMKSVMVNLILAYSKQLTAGV